MGSAYEINRLEKWVAKALEESTNEYSVVMVLGNSGSVLSRELIAKT